MSKTEGEYELVLGNRQLLSAFFIIVILFGVFFTMGYVVGRNSGPTTAASAAPNVSAANQRPETPSPAPSSQPAAAPPPVVSSPRDEPKEAAPETKPTETTPAETQPAVRPEKSPVKTATREGAHSASTAKSSEAPGRAVPVNPGPGNMYLQVVAVGQPQANIVVDTLKQKGFPTVLAQSPNPSLFRVMVGPFGDAAALGKAKADLENAGFKPLVRK